MDEEIEALIEQLSHPQFSARKVAARKLERLGLKVAPGLRQVLQSVNPITVARAAQILGSLGDMEAIPRLQELLGSDNVDISSAAYDALQRIARHQNSAEARDRMLAELRVARKRAPSFPVTLSPIVTNGPLVNHPSPPISFEQSQRRAALSMPHTVSGLIATLRSKDYQKRSAATNALVECGLEAVIPLCEVLEDRSPVVRQRAVEALGRIQDMSALLPLLNLLRREVASMTAEASVLTAIRDAVMMLVRCESARPYTTAEAIALARLVSWQASIGLPGTVFIGAANRLRALSHEAPSPELRSALPYLRGIWPFVPREYAEARKAIEEATKAWADLPIASTEPAATTEQNLPRPTDQSVEPVATSLPLPTETREKPVPEKPKLQPLPTDLDGLIEALHTNNLEWCRRVEGALFIRGHEAVAPLRIAFVRATTATHQGRIARVLAGIGDPAGLVTIWVSWKAGQSVQAEVSLKAAILRIGAQLPVLYQNNTVDDQLYLLAESREHMPELADYVAQALKRRAKECPTPELRRALPLLKGSFLHPVSHSLESARIAIEKATAVWAALPIASTLPASPEKDLPRPAEEAGASLKNLPRPTEDCK